ncbi:hypothetical protein SAMN04487925_104183 [Bradyrhizobium sp. cf659]|nr:hypothetical protein SAMN04487925_104183 [Bradyrhizobium sp. cf659]
MTDGSRGIAPMTEWRQRTIACTMAADSNFVDALVPRTISVSGEDFMRKPERKPG